MNKPFPRAILLGAALWLAATIAIRLAGQFVLRPQLAFVVAAIVAGGALMAVIGPRLRLRISHDPADADSIALGLILPGMVADAAVAFAFRHVYPNLSPAVGNDFAALMLWYYAVAALAITLQARAAGDHLAGDTDARTDDGRPGRDRRRDHDQDLARPA